MYDFLDRQLTGLDAGGRFLVWSMRSWVKANGGRACPAATIGPAFAKWKLIAALQPFHRAMLSLNAHALETFRFCPLSCNHVNEHEAILLAIVRTLGEGDPLAARDTLALIVDEDWLGDCLGAFSDLASAMDDAALLPRAPEPAGGGR